MAAAAGAEVVRALELSLRALTLIELAVPRRAAFRSAIGTREQEAVLLVRWTDRDGDWGLGECGCRADPYFNGEFVAGAVAVLRDFVFPRLPDRGTLGAVAEVAATARGWNFTAAALLEAACDLLRRKGQPDGLDRWPEPPAARVPVGIALPIFETEDAATARVAEAVAAGYRRVKMKVAPGMPLAPLRAVREVFPDLALGFDANGRLGTANGPLLDALADLAPDVLEQPFAPDRLDLCAALRARRPGLRICLDESIAGLGHLMAAHRLGALDELNLKPGRVGGPLATLQILHFCAEAGLPAWVGGMFETGVGRAANLRVAARLPAASAHDLSPPGSYLAADVVTPPMAMDADGFVPLGDERPVTLDEEALAQLTTREIVLEKS